MTNLQRALKALKLFDGEINGSFGETTVDAVNLFRRVTGQSETGEAAPALQTAIFEKAKTVRGEFGDRDYNAVISTVSNARAKVKVSSSLHLRQKASTSSKSLARMKNGAVVTVLEKGGKWSRVQYGSAVGYVMNSYLRLYTQSSSSLSYEEAPVTPAPTATAVPTETPAPTAEPTPEPEPTATPSPTPAPTMAVYDEVSFDDWRDGADCTMPDYTFSAPHKPQPQEQVTWPTDGVTLCYNAKTLEEAAEIFHTTVENIKELNPDWQDNYSRNGGRYWALKVQADPYTLPMNNVVTVTVNAPWVESYYDRTEVCDVPASLDKQARAALASAYYFQYHWWGMHAGFLPYEKLDEPVGFFNYRAADGAFYTKFSEFGSFLHTVYSDAWVDDMLSMDPAPFAEGENDTILTLDGDRGGNIAYCGHLFTEPELQPDGSLAFWQLSLTCESDDFKGWAGEETIVPDTATVTTVRLVPTENGWRVDALELPN